ncbi:transposase [Sulfuriferula sp. AH1]|uniref:transposase n=1 Tax=Sulfuriferula sp. AH1 TaxID=1985873 RepID=UPI0012FAA1BB|nr:transposase [Sulfuriferula sp. AH1]
MAESKNPAIFSNRCINFQSALCINLHPAVTKEIAELQRTINDHINGHPELKQDADLIASIPGIGEVTVAKVLAYAGDIRRFANGKALAAFIGVSPRQRQSGSSIKGRTMISRTGHADLRKALYMPGMVALRHNTVLQAFGERMKANGLVPKAVIGAAMRKLVHIIYGVVKSGRPFDANFANRGLAFQDGISYRGGPYPLNCFPGRPRRLGPNSGSWQSSILCPFGRCMSVDSPLNSLYRFSAPCLVFIHALEQRSARFMLELFDLNGYHGSGQCCSLPVWTRLMPELLPPKILYGWGVV